jgi:glycosyltransferase A (GT-A) superfamily protein (DUF2064 family)
MTIPIMQRLILFAKIPRLGRVKTRLVPPLTPEQALTLYRAFLLDQIAFLSSLSSCASMSRGAPSPAKPDSRRVCD